MWRSSPERDMWDIENCHCVRVHRWSFLLYWAAYSHLPDTCCLHYETLRPDCTSVLHVTHKAQLETSCTVFAYSEYSLHRSILDVINHHVKSIHVNVVCLHKRHVRDSSMPPIVFYSDPRLTRSSRYITCKTGVLIIREL